MSSVSFFTQKKTDSESTVLDYSILREYQLNAIIQVETLLKDFPHVVLSIPPSNGKTITSLFFIQKELEGKGALRLDQEVVNGKKIIIILRDEVVLKMLWQFEIDRILSEEQQKHVIIETVQNLNKIQEEPCFVIVDEAHQFYFTDTTINYLAKYLNAKRLLLTSIPSKFVYENDQEKSNAKKERRDAKLIYPIHFVDGASLVEQGFLSDLAVHAVSTVDELDLRTYFTATGELNEDGVNLLEENVELDLTKLIKAMFEHLKSLNVITRNSKVNEVDKCAEIVFNKLQKTQIVCASITQARAIYAWLKKRKIKSVLSEYTEDQDIDKIHQFTNNPDVKVFVVVNKASLEFSLVQLGNVVDMTGSKNINSIYQLISQAMRKNENMSNKFFYKVFNVMSKEVGNLYLEAALYLLFQEFSSKWNGENLEWLQIPVYVRTRREENPFSAPEKLFESMNSVKTLRNIIYKANEKLESYKMMPFVETEIEYRWRLKRLNFTYKTIYNKLREAKEVDGIKTRWDLNYYKDKDGNKKYAGLFSQATDKAPELLDRWFPLIDRELSFQEIDELLKQSREVNKLETRWHLLTFRDKNDNGNSKYRPVLEQASRKAPELLEKWYPSATKSYSYQEIDSLLKQAYEVNGIRTRWQLKTFIDENEELKYLPVYVQANEKAPKLLDKWFPIIPKELSPREQDVYNLLKQVCKIEESEGVKQLNTSMDKEKNQKKVFVQNNKRAKRMRKY